jgi:uncharacterized protein YceH (UPF0502 family)
VTAEAVETEIAEVAEELEMPLWRKLDPAPGQKEARYTHFLFGADAVPQVGVVAAPVASNPAIEAVQQRNERIGQLEERVAALESELAEMRASFAAFREQFN